MHHHQGGTGSVLVNVGHLHLESGDIDRASTEAKKAFSLGDDKRDHILMARARTLQAAVELANTAMTPGPGDASVVNSRRKWPFYGTGTRFGTDLGRGNYNSLQVKADRRFASGFQTLISYTFAKTMDNGSNAWYSGSPQNSYDVNADYGLSDADRRQILSMTAIYQFPFGKGRKWFQHGVSAYTLGGWQINAIGRAQSGNPVVLQASGDPANIGNTQYNYARPDVIGIPTVLSPSTKQWFNADAFKQPSFSYGKAPRGLLRQPSFQNADLSVFKNISIYDEISLQLRLEAFNAFNLITRGNASGRVTNNINFGQIHSTGSSPRELQFGAKLYF
jgi:hypothetical protein